jgi:hypothetical protein
LAETSGPGKRPHSRSDRGSTPEHGGNELAALHRFSS